MPAGRFARGLGHVVGPLVLIIGVSALLFWRMDLPAHTAGAGYAGLTAAWLAYLAVRPARAALVVAVVAGVVVGGLVYSPQAQSVAESGLVHGGSVAKSGLVHGGSGARTAMTAVAGWVKEKIG